MRIVHVSDCYPPRVGGIESQVRDLARHQSVAGDDVHVITATPPSEGPTRGVGSDGLVTVHRVAVRMPFDLPVHPRESSLLHRLLAELKPDVVHVQAGVVSPFAFDGLRSAHRLHLPTVVTWHCMLEGVITPLRVAVRALEWDRTPMVLSAVSGVAAAQVAQVFPGANVAIIPNGIDVEDWQPGGVRGVRSGGLNMVSTMRLAPRKRVIPLLRIVQEARHQVDAQIPLRFTLIGSGPMQPVAQAFVDKHEMSSWVELPGRVDRAELLQRYQSAEAFIAPAVKESFGIAALEARTAGLAVIGRTGTGLSEFVTDGVEGYLVDSDDDVVRRIVRLASRPAELGALMRHNATTAPEQSWRVVLTSAHSAYSTAILLRRRIRP